MMFQTSDVSICNGNKKNILSEYINFLQNCMFKLFLVSIAVANIENIYNAIFNTLINILT